MNPPGEIFSKAGQNQRAGKDHHVDFSIVFGKLQSRNTVRIHLLVEGILRFRTVQRKNKYTVSRLVSGIFVFAVALLHPMKLLDFLICKRDVQFVLSATS